MGRITLDGKVSQYSTGEDVQPKFWDANKGRAVIHGQNPETSIELRGLNRKLEELEEKARTAPIRRAWTQPGTSRLRS